MDKTIKKNKIEKGDYGHARRYKNQRIVLLLFLFLCILIDVVMALIIYQTRLTALTVLACVLSLPFAKVLISYLMVVRFEPLSKEDYETSLQLSEKYHTPMIYDMSISDSDAMVFFPCTAVYNNNLIAFVPDAKDLKRKNRYQEYLKLICADEKYNFRTVITKDFTSFEKELSKLTPPKAEQIFIDEYIMKKMKETGV